MTDISSMISTGDIQVDVTVRLGRTRLTIAEISRLKADDVVALDQDMVKGVQICIGDKVIAHGELATVDGDDGRLCVRVLGAAD